MFVYKRKSFISKKGRVLPMSRFTNSKLGDYSYVGIFAYVNNTTIGKFCSISMNFKSGMGQHPTKLLSSSPFFYSNKHVLKDKLNVEEGIFQEYEDIKIGNDVWIGTDVFIMDGVTVGDGAIIGSKAVVVNDVPDYAIVGGVPAKVIKHRFSEEIIKELKKLRWWDWDIEKIERNKNIFSKELNMEILNNIIE
jgi:acetyltransferase-like isoleucine patch superfamily enzyme